ncbi:MAG: transketolase [Limnochordaceae bacterium]|nr:transketolase [Limnochordaceae bacterium]
MGTYQDATGSSGHQPDWDTLRLVAKTVRVLAAEAVQKANSGHPGLPLGAAEIGVLLFAELLRHDPTAPDWPDRDRFVLSAGHGSMLLYALLHLSGYDLPMSELERFRQLGSRTPGHPEYGRTVGVETTTGPLGQGIGNAVGMAIAERMLAARYNRPGYPVVGHWTYVLAGDGDMMEGVSSEAASLAGHWGLGRLIVIYDSNRISIEGQTDLAFTESVATRFQAYGWTVTEVDGHDLSALYQALTAARDSAADQPHLIIAHTHIGRFSDQQDSAEAHGAPLGEESVRRLKQTLGWPEQAFYVPPAVYTFFAEKRCGWQEQRQAWESRFAEWQAAYPDLADQWQQAHQLSLPAGWEQAVPHFDPATKEATRNASGKVLQALAQQIPYLVGGSADLAPSTKTYLENAGDVEKGHYEGRNFHFGVREHAMGAILNGIALHKGLRPFGSTFLVFSDYMRPSIRLAALMRLPVIYVFTHDSIAVGEDGPTHQPVEQTESLRLIPGLTVFRPADAEETRQAWIEAIKMTEGPVALILTRQSLPTLSVPPEVLAAGVSRGGYLLTEITGAGAAQISSEPGSLTDSTTSHPLVPPALSSQITFVASGSEVSLALAAARLLAAEGNSCRVVSVPCRERFLQQPLAYQRAVLDGVDGAEPAAPGTRQHLASNRRRVFLEAGVASGWLQLARPGDQVVAMQTFGESGPASDVARHFGFSPEQVAEKIRSGRDRLPES